MNDPCHQPDSQIDRALGQEWPVKLKKHVDNAAIAQQLTPPTAAQFLAKCEAVQRARDLMANRLSVSG